MMLSVTQMTITAAPQKGRKAAWFSVMPLSSLYGTCRTCRGRARPRGSNGSMEGGSAVDGECGTKGVNRVMTSASLSPLNRLRVGSGHRRSLEVVVNDASWCAVLEDILDRADRALLEDVLVLCSPMVEERVSRQRERVFMG